jgi:uncharacterized integral membrane protein (TIGR00698 family)
MEMERKHSAWSEDIWALFIGSICIFLILVIAFIWPDWKLPSPVYSWASGEDVLTKLLALPNLVLLLVIGIAFLVIAKNSYPTSIRWSRFLKGFVTLFGLAILSLLLAGQRSVQSWGIEYVVFALLIGLIWSNVFHAPAWLLEISRSEFFIKTGLVILGSSVLFTDMIRAGLPGLLQALVVVLVVWFVAMWLCRKLGLDDEFSVILASAVSICGVSAAIVAAGAIQGDKKKLSYVTTLVLLVAIPMLILQPWIIRYFHIPEVVGGAWLGGTLDTTASVTAASQLVGPAALKAGVIVKFSQNVLIGVAAFFIAGWWALRTKETSIQSESLGTMLWAKFPKFVLGFIAVSLIFSFVIPKSTISQASGLLNSVRTLWFAMAFVAIGLEARFGELIRMQEGRPAFAFILAQLFNILWTLLWAYLLFGGYFLPLPDLG